MTNIENIGVICFTPVVKVVQTDGGYKTENILEFKKINREPHYSWLNKAVFEYLSKPSNFLYKKGKEEEREPLFRTWSETEFSFKAEYLDEVLQFLNQIIFKSEEDSGE